MIIRRAMFDALALAMALSVGGNVVAANVTITVTSSDAAVAAEAVVYAVPKQVDAAVIKTSTIIDQVNKEFLPLVSVVRTGTPVSFPNSDNIRHQVYSFSPAKTFTLKLYSGRPSSPVVFEKPGVVTLGCNIHDRMIAWLLIVDTPWYSLTDAAGTAVLKNVAAGDYDLYVWHPGMSAPVAEALRLEGNSDVSKSIRIAAIPIAQIRKQLALDSGAPHSGELYSGEP